MKQWKTKRKWVDIETGEELKLEDVRKDYRIIGKDKKITQNETRGITEYTIKCQRTEQLRLF